MEKFSCENFSGNKFLMFNLCLPFFLSGNFCSSEGINVLRKNFWKEIFSSIIYFSKLKILLQGFFKRKRMLGGRTSKGGTTSGEADGKIFHLSIHFNKLNFLLQPLGEELWIMNYELKFFFEYFSLNRYTTHPSFYFAK